MYCHNVEKTHISNCKCLVLNIIFKNICNKYWQIDKQEKQEYNIKQNKSGKGRGEYCHGRF